MLFFLLLSFSSLFLLISFLLFLSIKKNFEFLEKIDEIQESLQIALETLQVQHQKIKQKTKIEVFSDEPIVRELVKDLAIARDSILNTAKLLDDSLRIQEEDEESKID